MIITSKSTPIFILCLTLIFSFSCQTATARVNPVISKKYTNEEIVQMMQSYRITHSTDVMPSALIQNKFVADFPNAKDIEWETALNIYEVDFEIGRTDYEAYYDSEGNLIRYSFEIRTSELPAIVKNAVMAKYPDYNFEDADEVHEGTDTFYKVEIERKHSEMKLWVRNDGVILKEKLN